MKQIGSCLGIITVLVVLTFIIKAIEYILPIAVGIVLLYGLIDYISKQKDNSERRSKSSSNINLDIEVIERHGWKKYDDVKIPIDLYSNSIRMYAKGNYNLIFYTYDQSWGITHYDPTLRRHKNFNEPLSDDDLSEMEIFMKY